MEGIQRMQKGDIQCRFDERCDNPNCPYKHTYPRNFSSTPPVCVHFIRGNCREGENCRFSHVMQPRTLDSAGQARIQMGGNAPRMFANSGNPRMFMQPNPQWMPVEMDEDQLREMAMKNVRNPSSALKKQGLKKTVGIRRRETVKFARKKDYEDEDLDGTKMAPILVESSEFSHLPAQKREAEGQIENMKMKRTKPNEDPDAAQYVVLVPDTPEKEQIEPVINVEEMPEEIKENPQIICIEETDIAPIDIPPKIEENSIIETPPLEKLEEDPGKIEEPQETENLVEKPEIPRIINPTEEATTMLDIQPSENIIQEVITTQTLPVVSQEEVIPTHVNLVIVKEINPTESGPVSSAIPKESEKPLPIPSGENKQTAPGGKRMSLSNFIIEFEEFLKSNEIEEDIIEKYNLSHNLEMEGVSLPAVISVLEEWFETELKNIPK